MQQVTLDQLSAIASNSRQAVWDKAGEYSRDPKIYLHWTAGTYDRQFDDYHINIDGDGNIFVTDEDLSVHLNHTYMRNTGAIGIALDCCAAASTTDLNAGGYAPTAKQIEVMAQVIQVVADGLWLTIDKNHVMTHGEAADNEDGMNPGYEANGYPDGCYGPKNSVERWDLEFLGTSESPSYNPYATDGSRGGDVLRGKALWYKQQNG